MDNSTNMATLRAVRTSMALATLGTCREWDARLTTYLRADALAHADFAFGDYGKAYDQNGWERLRLEEAFGKNYRQHPAGAVEARAATEKMKAAEECRVAAFLNPLWEAERELALTPAPTLAAALFKMQLIEHQEVWNSTSMPRDGFEIVAEDFARLEVGAAAKVEVPARRLRLRRDLPSSANAGKPLPFSPGTLAERWACSSAKVRRMCRAGELAWFPVGCGIRIPAAEVERFERAEREAASAGSEDASPPPDEKS
jgi:hypothetical protein